MGTPAVPGQDQPEQARPRRDTERTIAVTCSAHGAEGFCNLRITRVNGEIVLDPHVAGCCVLRFDETASAAVFDLLGEWLG